MHCTVLLQYTALQQKISNVYFSSFPFTHPNENETVDWPCKFASFLSDYYCFVSYRSHSAPIYFQIHIDFLSFSFYFLCFLVTLSLNIFLFSLFHLFSKRLLLLCFLQVSQRSYMFSNPYRFPIFFLLFPMVSCYLLPLNFSFSLLNYFSIFANFWWNNCAFMQKNHTFKNYPQENLIF